MKMDNFINGLGKDIGVMENTNLGTFHARPTGTKLAELVDRITWRYLTNKTINQVAVANACFWSICYYYLEKEHFRQNTFSY